MSAVVSAGWSSRAPQTVRSCSVAPSSSRAVDLEACAGAGVEVVRRRSGGGAVLVEPGSVVWVDVLVAATDRAVVAPMSVVLRGGSGKRGPKPCGVPGSLT